ncbi:MAG TPA: cation diffusion facilitator family transporter [Oceanipulchritudo sp.]|nr:cation diffusion facilitator family transporter [Oceanipulchritudo sp.]
MAHNHNHSHSTEGVGDGVLLWTILINFGLSVFEFIAGILAGSMALMADALHNTNDAAALLIAYIARKISRRGADEKFTFGYRRAELIGAMIQLTALIVVGLYLLYEGVNRFFNPEPLLGGWIMVAAAVALVVDVATAWLLWAMSKGSLNVKAAFLHNLTDAGASFAVLLGGAAIHWLDWNWVDPLLTLAIAGYILYMSTGMLRRTSAILMEGTPPELSLQDLRTSVKAISGVADLHHLHVWELDEHHRALEAHVVIDPLLEDSPGARHQLRQRIKDHLSREFNIPHSTLELETVDQPCGDTEDVCGHAH